MGLQHTTTSCLSALLLHTCEEVDKVLEVLHDCWAEGNAAQGDCLVPDDLPATLAVLEGRTGNCTAPAGFSNPSRKDSQDLPQPPSFVRPALTPLVHRRHCYKRCLMCERLLLAHMVAQLWMECAASRARYASNSWIWAAE